MSSGANKSMSKQIAELQSAINGITTYLGTRPIVIEGKVWKAKDAVALLQGQITALQNNAATHASWLQDVAAQRASSQTQVTPFMSGLRTFVSAQYGGTSDTFRAFGFVPRKQAGRTVAAKSQAVAQGLATRKARGTMGPKAKLAIRGVVPSVPPSQPTVTSSAQPTTPSAAASGSQPNGAGSGSH